jgi:fatty acid desaturase
MTDPPTSSMVGDGASKNKKLRFFTPEILSAEIKRGRDLFIFENKVFDATKFKSFHPGGNDAIERMVGKDATDEVRGFHPPWVISEKIPLYCVGEFLDPLNNESPSTSRLAQRYRQLDQDLRSAGFYKPDLFFYCRNFAFFFCIWIFSIYVLLRSPGNISNICVSAFTMGLFWHGLSFITHDAGHNSVSGVRSVDYVIGIFLASFFGGLSVSWWKDTHNTHHVVTNDPENDPDIQHIPFFAISPKFFDSLYSNYHKRVMVFTWMSRLLVSVQHYSFIPILTFGRFNLQVSSLSYLLNFGERREHRCLELFGIFVYFYWYAYWLIGCHIPSVHLQLLYLYLSYASTALLHLQITLSHFAMSTTPVKDELFIHTCLRTTMNIDCPEYLDWVHGGLQFQVEHHLFPRLPRVHLRKVAPLVRSFCEDNGLVYYSFGFLSSNVLVYEALRAVARKVTFNWMSSEPTVKVN